MSESDVCIPEKSANSFSHCNAALKHPVALFYRNLDDFTDQGADHDDGYNQNADGYTSYDLTRRDRS